MADKWEQEVDICLTTLVKHGTLPPDATRRDANMYLGRTLNFECEYCGAYGECPIIDGEEE